MIRSGEFELVISGGAEAAPDLDGSDQASKRTVVIERRDKPDPG
ncbi:MAG: hypothetical protein ACYCZN_15770 [Candidatus Dormibacteria bacterium]